MIFLNTPELDLTQMKKLILDKIKYHYMDQHISQPKIDEDKLALLIAIIDHSSLAKQKKIQYVIATMLVQIALDTHELISDDSRQRESAEGKLTEQLNVLAGDYYSGLYYYLLANVEEIEFIRLLASAIREINENKMKLYYKEIQSFPDYVATIRHINGLLISQVASFFNNLQLEHLSDEWITLASLYREREKIVHKQSTMLSSITGQELDAWLQKKSQSVVRIIRELPSTYNKLKKYFLSDNKVIIKTSVSEEG